MLGSCFVDPTWLLCSFRWENNSFRPFVETPDSSECSVCTLSVSSYPIGLQSLPDSVIWLHLVCAVALDRAECRAFIPSPHFTVHKQQPRQIVADYMSIETGLYQASKRCKLLGRFLLSFFRNGLIQSCCLSPRIATRCSASPASLNISIRKVIHETTLLTHHDRILLDWRCDRSLIFMSLSYTLGTTAPAFVAG